MSSTSVSLRGANLYLDPAQRSIVDGSVAGADPRLSQRDEFLSLKKKTQCDYGRMLNVFAPIGHHLADSVAQAAHSRAKQNLRWRGAYPAALRTGGSLLFNFSVGNDYVETNPASRMKSMDRPRA